MAKSQPKRKNSEDNDDTPRAFKRLMDLRSRMATGKHIVRKEKSSTTQLPKINPGESLRDFNRRINDSISVPKSRGVASKSAEKVAKRQRLKANNLRAEYHQRWEAKRSKLEQYEDGYSYWMPEKDDEDPWAEINARKEQTKFGEVADKPPELPRLKAKSNTPRSAGSIARRELLEEERKRVIAKYREMKDSRREEPKETH